MKIPQVAAELFHADGQTDMTKLVSFRNFFNVPKNHSSWTIVYMEATSVYETSVTIHILNLLNAAQEKIRVKNAIGSFRG